MTHACDDDDDDDNDDDVCVYIGDVYAVGVVMAQGSSSIYARSTAFIIDNYQTWNGPTHFPMVTGNDTAPGRWGDYFDVQRNWVDQRTFIGTGMTQVGGSSNASNVPQYAWFGREDYQPNWVSLAISAIADEGGALNGIPITIQETDHVSLAQPDVALRRSYFDTRRFGKGNQGHDYPDQLSETEKTAVLEYLKTL